MNNDSCKQRIYLLKFDSSLAAGFLGTYYTREKAEEIKARHSKVHEIPEGHYEIVELPVDWGVGK